MQNNVIKSDAHDYGQVHACGAICSINKHHQTSGATYCIVVVIRVSYVDIFLFRVGYQWNGWLQKHCLTGSTHARVTCTFTFMYTLCFLSNVLCIHERLEIFTHWRCFVVYQFSTFLDILIFDVGWIEYFEKTQFVIHEIFLFCLRLFHKWLYLNWLYDVISIL